MKIEIEISESRYRKSKALAAMGLGMEVDEAIANGKVLPEENESESEETLTDAYFRTHRKDSMRGY